MKKIGLNKNAKYLNNVKMGVANKLQNNLNIQKNKKSRKKKNRNKGLRVCNKINKIKFWEN